MNLNQETIEMLKNTGIIIAILMYFVPYIIATKNKHQNNFAFLIINLLLWWTFVVWLTLLIIALTTQERVTKIIIVNKNWGGDNEKINEENMKEFIPK